MCDSTASYRDMKYSQSPRQRANLAFGNTGLPVTSPSPSDVVHMRVGQGEDVDIHGTNAMLGQDCRAGVRPPITPRSYSAGPQPVSMSTFCISGKVKKVVSQAAPRPARTHC